MSNEDVRNREDGGNDGELKVTDRRLFTADGSLREELPEDQEPEPDGTDREPEAARPVEVGEESAPATGQPDQQGQGFEHRPVQEPEGVDFTMLINAMAQPALIFLGEIPHPGTGRPEINLEQARLQVDLLELLQVKSRGNLSHEEEALLDRMLYELRMLYVARSQSPPPPQQP